MTGDNGANVAGEGTSGERYYCHLLGRNCAALAAEGAQGLDTFLDQCFQDDGTDAWCSSGCAIAEAGDPPYGDTQWECYAKTDEMGTCQVVCILV